jgi:hypothetical protein
LLRRKELAIEIVEAEIRSAQHEVLLDAAKLVLTGEPIEIARQLRARRAHHPADVSALPLHIAIRRSVSRP